MQRARLVALFLAATALAAPQLAHADNGKGGKAPAAAASNGKGGGQASKGGEPAAKDNNKGSTGVDKFNPNCGNGRGKGGADGAAFGKGRGNTCARALAQEPPPGDPLSPG